MRITNNSYLSSNQQYNNGVTQKAAEVKTYQADTAYNSLLTNMKELISNGNISKVVKGDMLLNIAFQVINSKKRNGFVGWVQENSRTINGVIKGIEFADEVVSLAKGGTALTANTASGMQAAGSNAGGSSSGSSAASMFSYAQQAYGAYKILSSNAPDDVKAQALAKQAALFVADIYTFGLASTAYSIFGQSGTWQKIEGEMMQYSPVMQGAGSLGKVWGGDGDADDYLNLATGGMFSVAGNILGVSFAHKSTKEYQAERAKAAFDAAITDADKKLVSDMYELKQQAASDNIIRDPSNPYNGKAWKWHEQKPLLKGEDVWGFVGFQMAFPDFISGYSEDQRRAIAQAALDEDLLSSSKGDIIFSNSEKTPQGLTHIDRIKQIALEIKAGSYLATNKAGS